MPVSIDQQVREAMVSDPLSLDVNDSAQAAGEALMRPEVRAVLVCDEGRLVGIVTRKTLVREVVAAGLNPATTLLRAIAETPNTTVEASMPLADAYALLEEADLPRVPVIEHGVLVGVLSRAVVQRRLSEDSPAEPDER